MRPKVLLFSLICFFLSCDSGELRITVNTLQDIELQGHTIVIDGYDRPSPLIPLFPLYPTIIYSREIDIVNSAPFEIFIDYDDLEDVDYIILSMFEYSNYFDSIPLVICGEHSIVELEDGLNNLRESTHLNYFIKKHTSDMDFEHCR